MKLLNIFRFPQNKLKSALTCHLRDKGYSPISDDVAVWYRWRRQVWYHYDSRNYQRTAVSCALYGG